MGFTRIWYRVLFIAWLWLLPTVTTHAEDWPLWMGPHANGISPETGWNSDWGSAGVPVLWKKNVGIGYSTVSVANGRLITMGHRDGNETIVCLNSETGEEVWHHTYPAKLVDNLNKGGPASTPTIDSDQVFTLSRDGRMLCLNVATGQVQWESNLTQETGAELPEWGFCSSIVVRRDQLLVETGGIGSFDRKSGSMQWRVGPFKVGYGTPVLFAHDGLIYAVSLNNEAVQVVDAAIGEGIDSSQWETSYETNSTTPIVHGDEIFISTGYKRGCELLRFVGKSSDGKKKTLKQVYEEKTMANHMNNSVLWQGHLYGVDGNSHNPSQCSLRCIEWKTGKRLWSQRGCGAGSLIVSDGKLIVLSDQGRLSLVKASPEKFEELASQEVLTGQCWTSPVLANGRIYCRSSDGDLVCLDVR